MLIWICRPCWQNEKNHTENSSQQDLWILIILSNWVKISGQRTKNLALKVPLYSRGDRHRVTGKEGFLFQNSAKTKKLVVLLVVGNLVTSEHLKLALLWTFSLQDMVKQCLADFFIWSSRHAFFLSLSENHRLCWFCSPVTSLACASVAHCTTSFTSGTSTRCLTCCGVEVSRSWPICSGETESQVLKHSTSLNTLPHLNEKLFYFCMQGPDPGSDRAFVEHLSLY